MNKTQRKHFDRLLTALRSGEYKQTQKQLRYPTGFYCCMGVGCDLAKDELGWRWRGVYLYDSDFQYRTMPPYELGKYFGIAIEEEGDWVLLRERSTTIGAAAANDELLLTFSQIADCLEWEYGYAAVEE